MPSAQTKSKPLPIGDWAVICTLRQEPRYRFLGSEYRQAERMVEQGLLTRKDDRMYGVTEYGERCYKAEKLLAQ